MILIADSGSTKTDWAVATNDGYHVVSTQGINPFHQSDDDIVGVISDELMPNLDGKVIDSVFFYGTGCTDDQIKRMTGVLSSAMGTTEVSVASDLVGAARALCGHSEGIACILGTGANSCLFDGSTVVRNIPPLGYILGDEGSGAVLGKLFMNAIFKHGLPDDIRELYLSETHQTYADIIRKVYREPLANRYLASVAMFISRHIDEYPELRNLVKENFIAFLNRNIDAYGRKDLPLSFVGSIAWFFSRELTEVIEQSDYKLGRIIKSPINGLAEYHCEVAG